MKLFLLMIAMAFASTGDFTIEGKVRNFNKKHVEIESGGQILQFSIERVVDRKDLRVGHKIEINLSKKVEGETDENPHD